MGSTSKNPSGFAPFLPVFITAFLDFTGMAIAIPIFAPLFLNFDSTLFSPITPLAHRTLLLGMLISCYPIALFFGAPILGGMSDRFGRKKILQLSLLGTALGYLLTALAIRSGNVLWLYPCRLISGFLAGNISVVQSTIADLSLPENKAKNFSLLSLAFSGGFIIGPGLGGYLSNPQMNPHFNYSTPFWFTFLLAIFNVLVTWVLFKETRVVNGPVEISFYTGFRRIKSAFMMVHTRKLLSMIFFYSLAWAFLFQFFQVFLLQKFYFNQTKIGNFYAYWGICSVLCQFLIARPLSARASPKSLLSFSLILLAIAMASLTLPSKWQELIAIVPLVALFQQISYPNIIALVSNAGDSKFQGEILGISQSLQAASQALPATISGTLVPLHPTLPTLVASCLILLSWVILLRVGKKKSSR